VDALREALRTGGRVVWRTPLSGFLLLEALGPAPAPAPTRSGGPPTPDPETLPHPWLSIDPATGRILYANPAARSLLAPDTETEPAFLGRLALPASLRTAIGTESDGTRPVPGADEPRVAVWWTDGAGRRELCLLPQPPQDSSHEDRHRRSLVELGRMAATLAHEIRNPVASVAGALDLLEESDDPEDRRQIVALARERLRTLTRLLDTALYLSRPMRQESELLSLGDLVRATASDLRADPLFAKVEIEVESPPDELRVHAPPELVRQALVNLLLNAAQAQEGEGRIEIRLGRDRHRASLRVIDDGPGIPSDRREEVFQPFYTTKGSGSGLGLTVVRRVADAVGGKIRIEDSARGACFLLELPIAPDPVASPG
jgi:signal transduction histidine kinase